MNRIVSGPEDFAAATGVSRETCERLARYAALLHRWQKTINLVGSSTVDTLWHRHFLDSAQLLPLLPKYPCVLADLGSGAGFPGLVLSLCAPSITKTHLYESSTKKAAFLRMIIRETGALAEVCEDRIEYVMPRDVDVITARALAPLPALLPMVERFWKPGTLALLHKGKDLTRELRDCSDRWKLVYDFMPSATDSAATILVIRSLARVGPIHN